MRALPLLQFRSKPLEVINGTVYFSGECDKCRPHCGAICCRTYGFVALTEEEAKSGRYAYKEMSEDCNCDVCTRMRELHMKYTLPKQPDGSCMYLDGSRRCSIYADRPAVCRTYTCVGIPFALNVAS